MCVCALQEPAAAEELKKEAEKEEEKEVRRCCHTQHGYICPCLGVALGWSGSQDEKALGLPC